MPKWTPAPDGALRCGAARECVTPPEALLPRLYGLMNQRFGGVRDALFVRALAVESGGERLLWLSFDFDKAPCPAAWLPELCARFDLPERAVFYTAIHCHSAPLTDERPYDGPNAKAKKSPDQRAAADEYERIIHDALFAAADRAVAALRPARCGYAAGDCLLGVNRNFDYADGCAVGFNPAGDADRRQHMFGFADAETGAPIAYLVNFAVHNTVLHANTLAGGALAVSPDLGGCFAQLLEARSPGAVALWTSGAAGDVNPVMMTELSWPDPADGRLCSGILAREAQEQVMQIMLGRYAAATLPLADALRFDCERPALRSALGWVRVPGRGEEYALRVHALRLGDAVFFGFSGELYTSFARQIQRLSPYPVTGCVNHDATFLSNADYILDDDACARGALGYDHSFLLPGKLAPAFDKIVPELLGELE